MIIFTNIYGHVRLHDFTSICNVTADMLYIVRFAVARSDRILQVENCCSFCYCVTDHATNYKLRFQITKKIASKKKKIKTFHWLQVANRRKLR